MRAAIYARYSAGSGQTDQSIEGQVRECTNYCLAHGLQVVQIYADTHISGKTDQRPEFLRMLDDCKQKKFDAVVVWKTDRFSRSKYDSVIYKSQIKKAGAKLFYAAESIPDGPEGIILESLLEGMAEYYSAELAQKVKRGMHESATKCRVLGNSIPLGYKAAPDKTYAIDEEQAEVVRKIFEMYLDGAANADICKYLNGLGYKTSRGNAFNKNSINRIISNEKYIGIYNAAGVYVENGVPAIIDKTTFAIAQKMKAKRQTGKVTRATTADYLLSGKLFCGHCGSAMNGVSGTSKTGAKHYYYYCPKYRRDKACDKKPVQKAYIESLVVDLTIDYILSDSILKRLSRTLWELQNESDDREEQIAALNKKLRENNTAIKNLMAALEHGMATATILARIETLESEKLELEREIAYQKTKTFGLTEEQLYYFLTQFIQTDEENSEAYRRRIIKAFVSKVFIFKDKIIIFYNISDENSEEISLEQALDAIGEFDREGYSSSNDSSGPLLVALSEHPKIVPTKKGVILMHNVK
ncbi:MAG: recombinase family protein [Eubacterium sp.]|nr:recombinase family protein [Candidatus Colimonas fimequi]